MTSPRWSLRLTARNMRLFTLCSVKVLALILLTTTSVAVTPVTTSSSLTLSATQDLESTPTEDWLVPLTSPCTTKTQFWPHWSSAMNWPCWLTSRKSLRWLKPIDNTQYPQNNQFIQVHRWETACKSCQSECYDPPGRCKNRWELSTLLLWHA